MNKVIHASVVMELQIKAGVIEKDPLPKGMELRIKTENRYKWLNAQAEK